MVTEERDQATPHTEQPPAPNATAPEERGLPAAMRTRHSGAFPSQEALLKLAEANILTVQPVLG
jgi:hypothetical protein